MFVLKTNTIFQIPSTVHIASRMLDEPNDVVYNCDFSKIVNKQDFVQDILDPIGYHIV